MSPPEETALPIPRDLLTDPNPGNRVARLAREAVVNPIMIGPQGSDSLKAVLNKMNCWNAATFIAWAARGINLPHPSLQNATDAQINAYCHQNTTVFDVVSRDNFPRLFTNWQQRIVPNAARVTTLQSGCFIGFIAQPPQGNNPTPPAPVLRHVMLHTTQGTGMAAGSNNQCIFPAGGGNWSLVPLNIFFSLPAYLNEHTRMVFTDVIGQII
jgi:hypothetical protein